MTFSIMLEKVDKHAYSCVKQLTQDIDLIVSNALLYNPDHTTQGKYFKDKIINKLIVFKSRTVNSSSCLRIT
jgi:hypothetical protein